MADANRNSQRRYRRRILGWGLLLLVLAFVIPAFFVTRWVHSDLENRVENELTEAGIEGVSAVFSGQDGTLTCDAILADPNRVIELAVEVYGVHAIDLDRSCLRAVTAPVDGPEEETIGTEPASTEPPTTDDSSAESTTTSTSEAPPNTEPELESIAELAGADPQFSQLQSLLDSSGLLETLGGDGPFTVLAPTDDAFDAAFEAVGADAFEALTSDPERLRTVLLHHVADGALASMDFESGPLLMLDETTVDVDISDSPTLVFTSGQVAATVSDEAQRDIEASNGVIHAIDQVLLPADFSIDEPVEQSTTTATLANGLITLTGTAQSTAQRDTLVAAAQAQVADGNVVDELVIDSDAAIADGDVDRLAQIVGALPLNLVSGDATLVGDQLSVNGVHTGEDERSALSALAAEVGADATLEARADADAATAQELQDELNEFVRLNPILFETNSSELSPEADSVVEQVAARAQRFEGVNITIIGHTDSDGDPAGNQELSDGRANSVLTELVALGIEDDTLAAEGRGESEPVLDADGIEDKASSRRVEFIVEAQA